MEGFEANAALIAAAPDLLAAMELVQEALANERDGITPLLASRPELCMEEIKYCIVDPAIAKATGEPQ